MLVIAIEDAEFVDGIPVMVRTSSPARLTATAVPTEVDDRRFELSQFAQQVERFRSPACHEIELVPVPAPVELDLDRPRLVVECQPIGASGLAARNKMVCLVTGDSASDRGRHGSTTEATRIVVSS